MQSLAETLLPVAYRFECEACEEEWAVLQFSCDQEINSCYRGELQLVGETQEPALEALLGQRISVHLHRAHQQRSFGGIVTGVKTLARKDRLRAIEVVFEPALALLGRGQDARVFQDKSAQEILREVLSPALKVYGSALEMGRIQRGAVTRDFCVQYQQSDLDFIQRLLQESGVNYLFRFDEARGAEVLHFFDETGVLASAENVDRSPVYPVSRETAHTHAVEHIFRFEPEHQLAGAGSSQRKWNWRSATHELCGQEPSHRWPGMHEFVAQQSRRSAEQLSQGHKDREHTQRTEQRRVQGHSHGLGLGLGLSVEIEDMDEPHQDGEFLITQICHRGQCLDQFPEFEDLAGEGQSWPRYENRFSVVALPCPLYPRISTGAAPRVGTQTAIVCGPEPGEVHSDDQGRVRLRFHWDRHGSPHEPGSCWVRVAHPWAGDGWGANFLPRAGSEVVVEFLDGDPEQPLVTAAVHNGEQRPLWPMPHNHHQSGIRTRSTAGGRGFNELRFDDQRGAEQLLLRAQKELALEVLDNKREQVGGQVEQNYNHDQNTHVEGMRVLSVGGDLTQYVGGSTHWSHGNACLHEVGPGGYEQRVQGSVEVQSQGAQRYVTEDELSVTVQQGGAQFSVAQAFAVDAGEVKIRCGGAVVQISASGEVLVDGGSRPVKIQGSKIHLNSK